VEQEDLTNLDSLRARAEGFARKIHDAQDELGTAQDFIRGLCAVCGLEKTATTIAAGRLANLHDAIRFSGYNDSQILLTRILFCLFAEATGLFGNERLFTQLILKHTRPDGRDLYQCLDTLFDTLNSTPSRRPHNLCPHFNAFPYVNDEFFSRRLAPGCFNSEVRAALINCMQIDWQNIRAEIFGTLLQSIMHIEDRETRGKIKKRRELGAYYTSERDIQKVIGSLFLDKLKADLKSARKDKNKLRRFLHRLHTLQFLDPACGCGNFLVVTYRELRILELAAWGRLVNLGELPPLTFCSIDQFHGIEIDPIAAQIAIFALWLTDYQMNQGVTRLGYEFKRLPFEKRANIVCANALRIDWNSILPASQCTAVMGNPPFVGAKMMNNSQRSDAQIVFTGIENAGELDMVAAWYVKAVAYLKENHALPVAFVSTNSITHGKQVGILWSWLLQQNIQINFAHRAFRWNNKSCDRAAVHCVIIGLGMKGLSRKLIFDYSDTDATKQFCISNDQVGQAGENQIKPRQFCHGGYKIINAKNINPYLIDAPNLLIEKRTKPLCDVPEINFGNQPIDGGWLLLSVAEKNNLINVEPQAALWIREYLGADELISRSQRFCLWLLDIDDATLKKMPAIHRRVNKVREFRLASKRAATRALSKRPTQFAFISHPHKDYIIIPAVSSEHRAYIPMDFMPASVIASNACLIIPGATLFHFGILNSRMHMAWMRIVGGRLEISYRYSAEIVYNNFPWPSPNTEQRNAIETCVQEIFNARAAHQEKPLAWMYNPETMPNNLRLAHTELDIAVDIAYGFNNAPDDAHRVAFLFSVYQKLANSHKTA